MPSVHQSPILEPHFLCNYATPKREDLERLVVTTIAGNWKPVALHLGVKQSLIDIVTRNNPKDCEEACRSVLDRWLKGDRNSGRKERTWRTVVEALEERSFGTQADQLIREMVDTGTHVTELKAVKDTTLQPGYDLSSYEYLVIGNHKGPAPKLRFIVQFEDIPSDCAFVVKAEMHLMYAYTCKFEEYTERDAPIITRHLCTHQVLCPWDETVGSSTYMNTPTDYLDEHTDCVTLASNDTIAKKRPNGYVPFDVTSAARNWVKGDPNCGLIVIDLNESMKGRDRHFYSSKGPSGSRPYLKLTYHKKEGQSRK